MSANYDSEEDVGFHFDPTHEEIIQDYLIPKLRSGEAVEGVIIPTKDVYAKEPWLLVEPSNDPFFSEDVWYYFTPRNQVSGKKIGCGKNTKRRITGDNDGIDRGGWKQNKKEVIIDKNTGNIIGTRQNLTYYPARKNNKKLKIRGEGASAPVPVPVPDSEYSWIMDEYMLPEHMLPQVDEKKYQELVLCKIHTKKSSKKNNDNEASTSTCHLPHESSSSSEQLPINHPESAIVKESNGI